MSQPDDDNKSVVFDSSEGTGTRDVSNPRGTGSTGSTGQSVEPTNPTAGAGLSTNDPRNTSSSDTSDSKGSEDVILYLARPDDSFRYGEVDDEVIVGREGKRFPRSEADNVLEKAKHNEVPLLERGLGELI